MKLSFRFETLLFSDSVFPTGGYAFSAGLEAAWQSGFMADASHLKSYIENYLVNQVKSEFPFIHSLFKCSGIDEEWIGICDYYQATITSVPMRKASESLGKNWLRLFESLYPELSYLKMKELLKGNVLTLHFLPVFVFGLKSIGYIINELEQIYLYQCTRDQMSAAIRLGVVGPMEGVKMQKDLLLFAETLCSQGKKYHYSDSIKIAAQIDWAQCQHEHLYSRLFQS